MIKKVLKIAGGIVAALFVLAGAGFAYLYFRKPATAAPKNIRVKMVPERVARGQYLFNLSDCDNCHSPHRDDKLYMPVIHERRGSGRTIAESKGSMTIPNITPDRETGLGLWTDGEKIRAIREGISKDGRALFPIMPYQLFRHMSDEDVESLVAYMNTLTPIKTAKTRLEIPFPLSMLIKGAPRPVTKPVKTPSRSNPLVYGEYLARVGVCEGCHTPMGKRGPDVTMRLAGGHRFQMKVNSENYEVVAPNLTPDRATGIGNWSAEYFGERFRRFREYESKPVPDINKDQFTIMPWLNLSKLPDEDLNAIYSYLMSLRPIENKVTVHPMHLARK